MGVPKRGQTARHITIIGPFLRKIKEGQNFRSLRLNDSQSTVLPIGCCFPSGLPVPLIDNIRSSATIAHLRVCASTLI